MNFRTDLALELRENFRGKEIAGIRCETIEKDNAKVTKIDVLDEEGAKALGKPLGKYITVEVPSFTKSAQLLDGRLEAVAQELAGLLPKEGAVLVAGLGNESITPDALGPKCSELTLATRHISGEIAKSMGLGDLRAVSAIVPGVLGRTGIETGEIIAGVVKTVKPSVVITVDALAARRLSRLGCTVQMATSGITPGSGVGNARTEINESTLGVPVVSIGVPTVVDAATLAYDLVSQSHSEISEEELRNSLEPDGSQMMITPREIDLVIERASRLVALAINRALQPHIEAEDLLSLVS